MGFKVSSSGSLISCASGDGICMNSEKCIYERCRALRLQRDYGGHCWNWC